MSPRRSSRARQSQPSPLVPTQTNSSNSSVTSDRTQRATRSHNKIGSPQRSIPRSQSQDDTDEVPKPPPRRTRSGHNEMREPSPSVDMNGDIEDEEAQEEDEITRCICGQNDYPGLCVPLVEMLKRVAYVPPSDQTYEQLGDVFLCCDTCHVWQHAGCVGILGKINEPDSYFCDECRPDLHGISTSPEGQQFSRYAPVMDEPPYRKSPKPSVRSARTKERPRSNTESTQQKRRITMNSRNEDEELARAIEESKKDKTLISLGASARNGKRNRDEDDEPAIVYIKRQRTSSSSPPHEAAGEGLSQDETVEKSVEATPRKTLRGAAAVMRNQAHEVREQREVERQAAADARKARSERRRVEESDHDDQTNNDTIPSTAPSPHPPEPTPATTRVTSKKRPTPARRGRVGRNQNARDRDSPGAEGTEDSSNLLATTNPHNTRARSRSRSVARDEERSERRGGRVATPNGIEAEPKTVANGSGGGSGGGGTRGGNFDDGGLLAKPSKAKNFNEKKTSMNEMKKRVAAILEFVHRAQTERADREGTSSAGMSRAMSEAGGGIASGTNGTLTGGGGPSSDAPAPKPAQQQQPPRLFSADVAAGGTNGEAAADEDKAMPSAELFEHLSAAEMLVRLKSRLVAFEGSFGRWGDGR